MYSNILEVSISNFDYEKLLDEASEVLKLYEPIFALFSQAGSAIDSRFRKIDTISKEEFLFLYEAGCADIADRILEHDSYSYKSYRFIKLPKEAKPMERKFSIIHYYHNNRIMTTIFLNHDYDVEDNYTNFNVLFLIIFQYYYSKLVSAGFNSNSNTLSLNFKCLIVELYRVIFGSIRRYFSETFIRNIIDDDCSDKIIPYFISDLIVFKSSILESEKINVYKEFFKLLLDYAFDNDYKENDYTLSKVYEFISTAH